jgi:hypothetical protein
MKIALQILNGILILITLFIGYIICFLVGREVLVLFKRVNRSELTVAHLNSRPGISLLCFGIGYVICPIMAALLLSIVDIFF